MRSIHVYSQRIFVQSNQHTTQPHPGAAALPSPFPPFPLNPPPFTGSGLGCTNRWHVTKDPTATL